VASNPAVGIVFWVVIRDTKTKKIIGTKQFKTHEDAVRYDAATDGSGDAADGEVSIEILATGKTPR
jgi:hypothetical protein